MKIESKSFANTAFYTLSALSLICLICYALMTALVFSGRIEALFIEPSYAQTGILLQLHALSLALLSAALALIANGSNKYVKISCMGVVSVFLLVQCVDSALVQLFNTRFAFRQAVEFSPGLFSAAKPLVLFYLHSPAGICTIILWFAWLLFCVIGYRYSFPYKKIKFLYTLAIVLCAWHFLPVLVEEPEQKIQLADWPYTLLTAPRTPAAEQTVPEFSLTYRCEPGLNSRQNIIVILVESVSSYMSEYFSGGQGKTLTPQLDKLARTHQAFTHHHANCFNTGQAVFSILTGITPVNYFLVSHFYKEPKFYQNTLANLFSREGYYTAFFTSAAPVYSKDIILARAGFDKVSDNSDPAYNGKPRFIFDAVSDDVLFDHAEHWITNYSGQNPYLLFIETATTHTPFVNPATGKYAFDETFLFADQAMGNFIEHLKQKKLLENTLVLITSDHHIFSPVNTEEKKLFPQDAATRVPLVVLNGPAFQQPISLDTTHTDLAPSLAYLALSQACFHPYQQNIFSTDSQRASCLFWQSISDDKEIMVDCQGRLATICLAENSSYFCKGDLPNAEKEQALSFINWIRHHNRY